MSNSEKFWDIQRDGVTQSMLGLFMTCPQKASYKLKEALELPIGRGVSPILWGDIFHRALDEMYTTYKNATGKVTFSPEESWKLCELAINKIEEEEKKKLLKGISDPSAFDSLYFMTGQCLIMLQAYFRQWGADFNTFNWIDLEKVFEATYDLDGVKIPIRGKYDGVFRDTKGGLWLFETKTKSSIDDTSIADKLSYDLQVMLYLWTMRQVYGENPKGVIYNIVRRPALRQKVKENLPDFLHRTGLDVLERTDTYFVRYNARITDKEVDDWANTELKNIMSQIYKWSEGEFNYKNTNSCNLFNRSCEFMRTCAHGDRNHLSQKMVLFPELVGGE